MSFSGSFTAVLAKSAPSALRAPPPLTRGEEARAARLRLHIEKRLLGCDHLLARAHGRAAAWFASADRLALPAANVAAIDSVNELSITLLKGRAWVLREWQAGLADGDCALVVGLIEDCLSGEIACLPIQMWPHAIADWKALRRAEQDEANLALGAWDGPEETLKLMEGADNVAS